jgi:hypothetical protein
MKTILFPFAMLASIAASAQVTNVTPISANYTEQTVSFRIWWNAGSRDATHLSKVWVWVDYITVNNNNATSGNSWTRATAGTVSGGVTSYDGSNRNGFWLEGNATTNYSATLTVQLTNVPAKFNWCAYVSDYPPNVTAANGIYTFRGTPPFTLTASNGTTQPVAGTTLTTSALTITPATIRDETACPGVFCPYQGSDLFIDATHPCQQRASGAKNWEAYIKDSRDNHIYHIVQFSDNTWWFADWLAIADKLVTTCGGVHMYKLDNKPSCPNGWAIPSVTAILNRWPDPMTTNSPANDPWGGGFAQTNMLQWNNTCENARGSNSLTTMAAECINCIHLKSSDAAARFCNTRDCNYGTYIYGTRVYCMRN